MKKAFKIIGYIVVLVVILVVGLVVTASLSQNKIVDIALKEISKNIHTPVEIEEVSFTFLKRFPYATFELKGIKVGASEALKQRNNKAFNQNILTISRAFVSVKSRPLIDGKFEIIKLELENADLFYYMDSLGKTNLDQFLSDETEKPADTSSTSIPVIDLEELTFKDLTVLFVNDSLRATANLYIPDLEVNGKLSEKEMAARAKGELQLSNCNFDSTNLYRMQLLTLNFDANYHEDTVTLKYLHVKTDGAEIETQGKIAYKNDLFANLKVEKSNLNLGELMKYAPDSLRLKYGLQELNGSIMLSGTVMGTINDSIIPAIDADFELTDGKILTRDYPNLEQLKVHGHFSNGENRNNESTSILLQNLMVKTLQSTLSGNVEIQNLDQPKYTISGQTNLQLKELQRWIPDTLAQNVSGNVIASFSTRGALPDSITESFIQSALNQSKLALQLKNVNLNMDTLEIQNVSGSFNYNPGNLVLKDFTTSIPDLNLQLNDAFADLTYTGPLTDLDQLEITFHKLGLELPQGKFNLTGKVHNLSYPEFNLDGDLRVHLAQVVPFISDTLITDLNGDLSLKIKCFGKVHPDSITTEKINELLFKQTRLQANFQNISATMPDDPLYNVQGIIGQINLIPDTITLPKLEGIALGIPFSIDSAEVYNAYNTVIKNVKEKLVVRGIVSLGALDHHLFDALLSEYNPTPEVVEKETTESTPINYSVDVKGKFNVESFLYDHAFIDKLASYVALDDSTTQLIHSYLKDQILVENISTKYSYEDSLIIVENFIINTFKGQLNSSARVWFKDENTTIINLKNEANKLDIQKLIVDFNELGQSGIITSQNVSGQLSGLLYSRFLIKNDTLKQDEVYVSGNLKLENGGLYNYKPAMEMRKFTGIKELDNIVFKTIETNLFVLENRIFVPKTKLVSTSFDAAIFGMQNLVSEDFEYHTHINLGDVLTGKNPKLFERQAKDGDIIGKKDKERGAVKLVYLQENHKTKTKFDTRNSQSDMNVKIRLQEGLLNVAFNPKLVSFKTGIK